MNTLKPFNQTKLFGLNKYILELIKLYEISSLPNKILLSGDKGLGKSTLAFHLINYVLSKNEEFKYDINKFEINSLNHSYKTVINESNPNLIIIDIAHEKKNIDIKQIRELIQNLNKSSLNNKPRFVLIDNIEFLNTNSINALLKILEEPNFNVQFILINNNKKILPTLLSRCINFRISLSHNESLSICNQLLDGKLKELINDDLINYYLTPGNLYNLFIFGKLNQHDLIDYDLKEFLKLVIKKNYYKNNFLIKYIIFELIECYFRKINTTISTNIYEKYTYFLKKISNTKKFNLDEEILFDEFNDEILNA